MKLMSKIMVSSLALAGTLMASNHQDFFFNNKSGGCISENGLLSSVCYDRNGNHYKNSLSSVRFRIIDAPEMKGAPFGIYLERPFFIIDGIHLSTTEKRTLSGLQKDMDEFGISEILTSLGYTPVLVQFSETVVRSLQDNSRLFAELLKYLSDNKMITFPNKLQEGYVVLGISQGGIIGRYGSYLYDTERKLGSAPIKLFSSLDSPHQGAVMPRSLIATLDFWANKAENASAEAFYDLISSPGARDLLIYDTEAGKTTYNPKTGVNRFLFGDYRKAAEYKGFPSVLVAQGQLKGKDPSHKNTYYELERKTEDQLSDVKGRASSSLYYSENENSEYAYNRKYEFPNNIVEKTVNGVTQYDFVQGSTYPFAQTLYESLRDGMEDAMPDSWSIKAKASSVPVLKKIPLLNRIKLTLYKFKSKWNKKILNQANSTFIPTVSAMDLKCDNDLAIRKNCAHNQNSDGLSFENPGTRSSAKAIYAVDPTHPRYSESMSGRHIESPIKGNSIDKKVLSGMQTDVWRVLCEVAKADYDGVNKKFRNPKLGGLFSPNSSCMDQSKMPALIKNGGILQSKNFGYIRYDYSKNSTEKNKEVNFLLPAGWNRVLMVDNGLDVPPSSIFEVEIKVTAPKSNWMKAELLLTTQKNGGNQIQFGEENILQDGSFQTIRFKMPQTAGALKKFRWFRLVLNSNGAIVTIRNPRLITNANNFEEIPSKISSKNILPNSSYKLVPWSDTVSIKSYSDGLGNGTSFEFKSNLDGAHIDFKKSYSMDSYKNLVVNYWPSTCSNTSIFFDAKSKKNVTLANGTLQNGFVIKKLPLKDLINTDITPKGSLSASRLGLQGMKSNEKCIIESINLE